MAAAKQEPKTETPSESTPPEAPKALEYERNQFFCDDGRPRYFDDEAKALPFVVKKGDLVNFRGKVYLVASTDPMARLFRPEGSDRSHFLSWDKAIIIRGVGESSLEDDPEPILQSV